MTLPAHVTGVQSMASAESGAFDAEDIDAARLRANCAVPSIEHARLARLTLTDETTATFNRRYYALRFQEEMGRARRGRNRLSIAFPDLDHFKQFNDAHGHEVGDLALRAFPDRVRAVIRRYDVLVTFLSSTCWTASWIPGNLAPRFG
jgi:predicted signal transduction protein with EAL and GGDEF domain